MRPVREPSPELRDGDLVLHGRVMPASNATFVGEVCGTTVVYKPVAGERPLWDFPDGTLADRERGAYLVSEAFGWDVVPLTFLRDGPHGLGMVQLWQEPAEGEEAVTIVRSLRERPGWLHVFDGVDERDQDVALVHEDSVALRRMAVFDAVVNNADRKGGHVLPMAGRSPLRRRPRRQLPHRSQAPHRALGMGRRGPGRRGAGRPRGRRDRARRRARRGPRSAPHAVRAGGHASAGGPVAADPSDADATG